MKIKILRDTVCDGENVMSGEVIDASAPSARSLIRLGKAQVYFDDPAKPKAKPEPSEDDVKPDSRITEKPSRKVGRPKKNPTKSEQ